MIAQPFDTDRLDLVPLRADHAEEMHGVLSDPALHTFIGGAPEDLRTLRARYERMTAGSPDPAVTWLNWVISLRAEGRLTGTIQATITANRTRDAPTAGPPTAASPTAGLPTAEIAWVVGLPWQGRGIATEAARGLVDWLGAQPVREIIAHIHPEHHASAAVAVAAGLAPTADWQDGEIRWRRSPAARHAGMDKAHGQLTVSNFQSSSCG
jgi:RimJ/RimL family protein N-acetyltransferase